MKLLGKLKTYTSAEIEKSHVSIGFECLDRDLFKPEKCYDLLGKSGVKYARCQTGWAKCEKQKGIYDFTWLDDIVDSLLSRGVLPWFNVGFGNPLYMDNVPNAAAVGCVPTLYGEVAVEAWKSFVLALTEHYKDRVSHYEIWNEPDCDQFWYPEVRNALGYAELVKLTGGIIRRAYPQAKIGGCIASLGNYDYVNDFAKGISDGDIDFCCYHDYSMVPENNSLEKVFRFASTLKKNGINNVELWQGEAGYPSWFPNNHWLKPKGEGSERQQAVWQLRRFFLDTAAGAKLTSFFQMADMMERPYEKARETLSYPARHGILNGLTYTPKKSYETISRLATVLSGDVSPLECYFLGSVEALSDSLTKNTSEMSLETVSARLIPLIRNGAPMFVYYIPYDIEAETPCKTGFGVTIGNDGEIAVPENPVLIDMYTGEVFEIEKYSKNKSGDMFITDLPYGEYPMVICGKADFEIETL